MSFKHFTLAAYYVAQYLANLPDLERLAADYAKIAHHLALNKVYLETYRSGVWVEAEKMRGIRDFFAAKGIAAAGGITATGTGGFPPYSLCYTREEDRAALKRAVEMTAGLFDEFILDDFFFTNCKCPSCIAAKGDRTWPEFRLALMREASENLVLGPARAVNPGIKVIIKYPNWYDHYQNTGYNLAEQPRLFDGIYTGTETRDPRHTQQTLPAYLSYSILRYLENVKPGKNGGGWFDAFDVGVDLALYLHQANLTLFAKAREITLFCVPLINDSFFPGLAAQALARADAFLGRLGRPVGIPCYKPYHSAGEEYLLDYLGMLGLPLEPTPVIPDGDGAILLTANAAGDPEIIAKMKARLLAGGDIFMTSGLLLALSGRGIEELILCRHTGRRVAVELFAAQTRGCAFNEYHRPDRRIILPHLEYSTNDSWPLITAFGERSQHPLLIMTPYGRGTLYLLTVPDDFGELNYLPREILGHLRREMLKDLPVSLDAPAGVGLFAYDNGAFIVQSFLPVNTPVAVAVKKSGAALRDLETGAAITPTASGAEETFTFTLPPNAYRALTIE